MRDIKRHIKAQGFTLIEMLLVLVIVSAIVMMGMNYFQQKTIQNKVDKTALEMQQILTAAMTFYAAKGVWPSAATVTSQNIINCLKGNGTTFGTSPNIYTCDMPLLPSLPDASSPRSPWMQATGGLTPYQVISDPTIGTLKSPNFFVYLTISATANPGRADVYARLIASKLPLGYTSSATTVAPPTAGSACATTPTGPGADCAAVSYVSPPTASLMNVGNVNFAGTYRSGGCVPEPICPLGTTPQVFVVPVSVTGYNDVAGQAYPITSFTAYALPTTGATTNPGNCPDMSSKGAEACPVTSKHWRVCANIQTQRGGTTAAFDWSHDVYLAAFTRCAPTGERNGGGIGIYE